ncbi:hypothetical protein CEK25_004166 [Fusarium fujikuroi]|nr:hypothetical protein CEK25_004166 [Fusarium fujikuroi]
MASTLGDPRWPAHWETRTARCLNGCFDEHLPPQELPLQLPPPPVQPWSSVSRHPIQTLFLGNGLLKDVSVSALWTAERGSLSHNGPTGKDETQLRRTIVDETAVRGSDIETKQATETVQALQLYSEQCEEFEWSMTPLQAETGQGCLNIRHEFKCSIEPLGDMKAPKYCHEFSPWPPGDKEAALEDIKIEFSDKAACRTLEIVVSNKVMQPNLEDVAARPNRTSILSMWQLELIRHGSFYFVS